ncbi:type I restriction-modification system endonuclease [Romboutsia maritimum]|uniref:Type I restriction-modification system endonuclease n=1 Tax=Romboutsia maritimum TaxID=2020948 RepID=A0A371IQ36_9FIRM|nr:type I restriction-modification system endonuclease [Romboutsia maritimum]RDY22586.1 type I restriction-modification system endonuclease [Romboutsia maritimum]
MSNFEFLNEKYPELAKLGEFAEKYIYQDSNTTFIKLGIFGEQVVKYIIKLEDIDEILISHDKSQINRIKLLKKEDLLPEEIESILQILRKKRNPAAHDGYENVEEAKVNLQLAHKLANWFMEVYGDYYFEAQEFIMPRENDKENSSENLKKLEEEYKQKIKDYEEQLKNIKSLNENKEEDVIKKEKYLRREKSKKVAKKMDLSEAETRMIIDEQLRNAGWEADTKNLRYSKGTRPSKNKNIAIAEWPTSSKYKKSGYVDYALFIGEKLVGFIEAKKYSKDVGSHIIESKTYAKGVKEEHLDYAVGGWEEYNVPFLFTSNGRKYIEEIKEKSGVHFLDCRKTTNNPKVLQNFYTPQNILELLESDLDKSNEELDKLSFDFLQDPKGVGLRYYQVDAIKAVENAIKEGKESALITMATGTGKTRTVLGLIYRLLKTDRFKRILFLVDRTSLGNQASETFEEVKIEQLQTLNQIYNINKLEDKKIDKETKIHVATVQAMVKRIMYNNDESQIPGVRDYDAIIIDEAHRGYILDKEILEEELEYKDEKDFLSKYKKVIDYFDAFKVALTATPALHTTQIFGKQVYSYTYRNAVIDGYLVDHEPPHLIKTKLSEEGIHLKKGQSVVKYDPVTKEVINGAELEDDVDFEIDSFNKRIIVESHTREALMEVAQYISPDDEGKTLIFATNDYHADMIVRILKEIYTELLGGVDDDSILKITGKLKDPELAIKQFKNERYPNIAVTVDLLSTGIDVPRINKLVFLRRVKSRILYEQMLGRATRLCDDIGKTHFEIYDCVKLYDALKHVTTMKPVVVDSKESFKELQEQLTQDINVEAKRNIVNKVIAKLQRKKKLIKEEAVFKSLSGNKSPAEFIKELKELDTQSAINTLIKNDKLISYLDEKAINKNLIIVTNEKDKVLEHTRGYGKGKKPEDYINEFENYIKENMNEIVALNVLCTKPKQMTRNDLKAIKAILDDNGFSEEYLKTAYKDMTNEEITADIIAFIRQKAIGSVLISKEERVKKAMSKIKKEFKFTPLQEKWLQKIEKYMVKEVIIDKEVFEVGNFKREGGFKRYNTIFENNLDEVIEKLKEHMFSDNELA